MPLRQGDSFCVATVLNGDYPNYTNSNFISPKFVVPSVEENPRLRFWHYFSTPEIHDSGVVKIYGEDSVWTNISPHYYRQSGVWTYALLDLREYAGQEVKIAFYFYSNATYTSTGWYIDDILVETGSYKPDLVTEVEDFSDGIGDWGGFSRYLGGW